MLNTESVTSQTAKLPPEDIAAEDALLGGILLDSEAITMISESLEVRDFYTDRGKKIFSAMQDVFESGVDPDVVTVASRLKALGQLADIGGQSVLEKMREAVLTAANVPAYSEMIHEKSKRRALIGYSAQLAQLAYDEAKPLGEMIQECESGLFSITQSIGEKKAKTAAQVMKSLKAKLLDVIESGIPPGIKTGFYDLDGMTLGGLQRKDLWILAGRPASGKTAFLVNIAQQVAESQQKPVQIFSLEMGDEQLVSRMWCGLAKVESKYTRTGRVSPEQFKRLEEAEKRIKSMPLLIDEQSGLTLHQICSRSRQAMRIHGELGAIFVDYLQIVGGIDEKNQTQGLGAVIRGLKNLAKELNVPVIVLSQLNRDVEKRTNKRPAMSDMRASGEIEEAADLIIGLYREEYYDPDTVDKGVAEVIILKNRNGETGTVKLLFEPEFTQFRNRAQEASYNPPAPKKTMRPMKEEDWD